MAENAGGNSLHTTSARGIVQVAGSVYGGISFGDGSTRSLGPPEGWERLVADARVWDHVSSHRDTRRVREQVVDAATRLSRLRDDSAPVLRDDPWHDRDFVTRFVEHVDWLLGEPRPDASLDLFPAEAALLVLVPLIYHVHYLQTAAKLVAVSPWRLAASDDRSADRTAFEQFADQYGWLQHRARLQPAAEPAIGWWVFHRWLVHRDYADERQVEPLCADFGDELAEVFTSRRVSALLHGLRRGPSVCSPEYLLGLRADDLVRRAGNQRIREQRLALLLALAYNVSIEMHTMPDIVAEHLGIPDPVDLGQLGETLNRVSWTGSHQVPVLSAQCHHAAVIEGLRTHVARTDEVLHAVHRTVRERITHPMPSLPARLSSDDVLPVDAAVTGWASFRVDGPRIREMLMGETLYKDRDLAVRELYQNALDACRHRKARAEYLNRTRVEQVSFDGRIEIVQDVDDDGREYVECRENGIGMGDAELRGVFSKAGARFAEQPDFKQEQAAWRRLDPPVEFYPNSRFGIGVLSYFMLADEIRVTTCRMGLDGTLGPVLNVTMFGPEHLFRITETAKRGDRPGTVVRLYLKDREPGWSAPAVLERLLGIAEFTTVAQHGDRRSEWAPEEVKLRERPSEEGFGYNAHGTLVEWSGAPKGVSVAWCAQGGALLVDGLVVQPAIRSGVMTELGSRTVSVAGLVGAVVNLTGEYSPERLSADRREVLSDVSEVVEDLLREAADVVLANDRSLLSVEWLSYVSRNNGRLGDVVTEMAVRHDLTLLCGRKPVHIGSTGFVNADIGLAGLQPEWHKIMNGYHTLTDAESGEHVPDNLLLWRLLAHPSNRQLSDLVRLHPDLAHFGAVRPALPSRQSVLTAVKPPSWQSPGGKLKVDDLVKAAADARLSMAGLFRELGSFGVDCVEVSEVDDVPVSAAALHALCDESGDLLKVGGAVTVTGLVGAARRGRRSVEEIVQLWRKCGVDVPDRVFAAATEAYRSGQLTKLVIYRDYVRFWEPGEEIPPGYLVRLSIDLDEDVPTICSRLASWGYVVDATGIPQRPTEDLAVMMSVYRTGQGPWLTRAETVPPACVMLLAVDSQLDLGEVVTRFSALGFTVAAFPTDASPDDLDVLLDATGEQLSPSRSVEYSHLFSFRVNELRGVVGRLVAYGFHVPFRLPAKFDSLDDSLFAEDGPVDWFFGSTGREVPFAKVILAASRLNMAPGVIVNRLVARGVAVSARSLPPGLSFSYALRLIDFFLEDGEVHDFDRETDLGTLLRMSREVQAPIPQVITWLRRLGVPTPDVVELIKAAAAGVPRAT
ncbi:HD domain-containing protein [Saccharothrix stipae]